MKRILTTLFTIALLVFITNQAMAQTDEPMVTMPGTSIRLPLPEGFKISSQFPGLIHENSATTVFAMEKVGTPFDMVVDAMDRDYFISQNMTFVSKENLRNSESDGVLIICSFVVDEVNFERAIYITGDHNNSKVIIANYPEIAKNSLEALVRACVSKIEF